jgi:hypothetical protein
VTIAHGQGTIFPSFADTGLTSGSTFYYVITASNSIGASALSFEVGASTLPSLPSPWTYADAGYATTPGNTIYAGGAFTVQGAGLDISGFANADSFGLCYASLSGDGSIVARLTGRSNYSGLHKSGLTLRESLANGAKHFTTLFNGINTNSICYRTSTSGSSTTSGSASVGGAFPQWQKITRVGNVFTGFCSADGTNWTTLGAITNTMSTTLLAGLAVTSRNNGALDTVVYDNVSVTGIWPPSVATNSVPLTATVAGANLQLSWPADHIGWRLETQTNSTAVGLRTNWFTVSGSSSTNQLSLPVNQVNGTVFFRLAYP